jgi:hypothetical protein
MGFVDRYAPPTALDCFSDLDVPDILPATLFNLRSVAKEVWHAGIESPLQDLLLAPMILEVFSRVVSPVLEM